MFLEAVLLGLFNQCLGNEVPILVKHDLFEYLVLLGGVVLDGCAKLFEVLARHGLNRSFNNMLTVLLLA